MKSFGLLLFLIKFTARSPDPVVRDDSHLDGLFVYHGGGVSDYGVFLVTAVFDTYLQPKPAPFLRRLGPVRGRGSRIHRVPRPVRLPFATCSQ